MKSINVIIERNEAAFFAYIPVIPGCTAGGWDENEVKQNMQMVLDICIQDDPELQRQYSNAYVLKFIADFKE